MTTNAILQIGLYVVVLVAAGQAAGRFHGPGLREQAVRPGQVLGPLERLIYRLCGIDPTVEMAWKHYAYAVLAVNFLGLLVVYGLLRLQDFLPLNPQDMAGTPPDLAFNTAVSFATNTNWQSYGGETTLSYLSQMLGPDRAELRLGGHRHGRAGGADSRLRPPAVRRRSATSGSI